MTSIKKDFSNYQAGKSFLPLFFSGDALHILKEIPDESINCIMTSPPYWGQRQYENGGIGLEPTLNEYISNFLAITSVLKSKLKNDGSFWLNLGDTYKSKSLQGVPWRVAFSLIDKQKWILRNEIIWNKHKGGLNSSNDKLKNIHETIFHFVKSSKYFYDDKAIRTDPRKVIVRNGTVISATGVSGIRYRRQVELSTKLTEIQKKKAFQDLEKIMQQIKNGEISDFRMVIDGQQRATHSNSEKLSGRAKELATKGYYFLKYHPDGSIPSDVWDIIPEDTQKRQDHYAAYPEDVCKIPILSTCPENGIILDPFCGTGTTLLVAFKHGKKSIGIDISKQYINKAKKRISDYGK
jgi:DNA modification methylase